MARTDSSSNRRRPSPWGWIVIASAVTIAGCGVASVVWWGLTSERQIATYAVQGTVNSVFLDLGGADADVVGGGNRPAVEVRRTDEFAFGRRAIARRDAAGGVLRIRSRCPEAVLGRLRRALPPDASPTTCRSPCGRAPATCASPATRARRASTPAPGDISVAGYCGFTLRARTTEGNVRAGASCAPERLELRSRTGDVEAVVPPGRYRVDAVSDDGDRRVRGRDGGRRRAVPDPGALAARGDVRVEASG